jgi:hypothetical protein
MLYNVPNKRKLNLSISKVSSTSVVININKKRSRSALVPVILMHSQTKQTIEYCVTHTYT